MTLSADTVIGVCGAGAMGAGIAQVAAQAGHGVVVLDQDEEALARGRDSVAKGAAALLKRGKIDDAEAAAMQERVRWTLDVGDVENAGLIIEAIVENAEIKSALFQEIEGVVRPDAVLATNTSSLSVTDLARGRARPERFLGLHFFNPAPVMKLVEVISGEATDAAVAAAAKALMESWGKVAVSARDVPGFIVNRVARPFYSEGWKAYEEGAAPAATLDFLFRELGGFRMGPLELGDLIGHDVNHAVASLMFEAYGERVRFAPSKAQARLVADGALGRKAGRGVYDYSGSAEKPEPEFSANGVAAGAVLLGPDAELFEALLSPRGVAFERDAAASPGSVRVGDAVVRFTDGRSAARSAKEEGRPTAVLDWMLDPAAATALAFAASDDAARAAVLGLAKTAGLRAVEVVDRPGLVVFRTYAQLANAAADAVADGVAEAEDVDQAMRFGVNYPIGPFAWARRVGHHAAADALRAIAEETGEPMYAPNPLLADRVKEAT